MFIPNALAKRGKRHDQYLALVLGSPCPHLCLAANARRASGLFILAFSPPESPNDTFLMFLVLGLRT